MNRRRLLCCTPCVGALRVLSGCGKSEPAQPAPAPASSAAAAARSATDVRAAPVSAAAWATAQPVTRSCYLDMVNGKRDKHGFDVKRGENNQIVGWVVDKQKATPAGFTLILSAAQSYALQGRTGGIRPDVAKAVGNAEAGKAGFAIGTTLSDVKPGSYEAMTLVKSPDGDVLCDLHRNIRVAD
jgi:hypothetical protein